MSDVSEWRYSPTPRCVMSMNQQLNASELTAMIRKTLGVKRKELNEEEIASLFQTLDKDGKGLISLGEVSFVD